MKKIALISLISLAALLSACNGESISSSSSNQSSSVDSNSSISSESSSSSDSSNLDLELFNSLKEQLFALDEKVIKEVETSVQTDDYGGGVSLDTKISSTTTKYQDNFIQTIADAQIEEDSTYSYIREKGIVDEKTYYDVVKFDVGEGSKTSLYQLGDNYQKEELGLGFSSFFATTMVNGLIQFEASNDGEIYHNFDTIDLKTEGLKHFYLKCMIGEDDNFDYKIEIEANVNIKDGLITTSNIIALQSYFNDTNFSYIEREIEYITGDISVYEGEKIDYELYL